MIMFRKSLKSIVDLHNKRASNMMQTVYYLHRRAIAADRKGQYTEALNCIRQAKPWIDRIKKQTSLWTILCEWARS